MASRIRYRIPLGIALLAGAGILGTSAVAARSSEGGEAPPVASPAPVLSGDSDALRRLAHALDDLKTEEARLEVAHSSFESDRSQGNSESDYLVSLTAPVRLRSVMDALVEDAQVANVYVWLWDQKSLQPVVGTFSEGPGIDLGNPEEAIKAIEADYVRFLDAAITGFEADLAAEAWDDKTTMLAWQRQLEEARMMREMVISGDLMVYGFTCHCAVDQLLSFEESQLAPSGSALRAVESADEYDLPIRPADPLRDAIIQSEGRL